MNQYLAFAFAAMVCYGVSAIFYKLASQQMDAASVTFLTAVSMALVATLVWVLTTRSFPAQGVEYAVLGGVFGGLGLLMFIAAIGLGNVSIATGIRGLSVAVTAIIAVLFLAERVTVSHAAGLLLVIAAIWLLAT